jgi:hypothetical protein
MLQQFQFVGQAYNLPATQISAQTCINWYPTSSPSGKFTTALLPRPGLELFAPDSLEHEVRALFVINNELYAVIDSTFYLYDNLGARKSLGTLSSSLGICSIIANDFQLFITDSLHGYVYQRLEYDGFDPLVSEHDQGDFFEVTGSSYVIASPIFTGAGLPDMSTQGVYTAANSKQYRVTIDSTGDFETPDTFKWSDNGGSMWNKLKESITGDIQDLNDGVQIQFIHTFGHKTNDRWDFEATIDKTFYVPVSVAYQDGYGVYIRQNSDRFYLPHPHDFSVVNALNFAKASSFPDNLTAGISIREELWLVGRTNAEVWYNVGVGEFPFERRQNLIIKYGCIAPYSLQVAHNNTLFWLAQSQEGGRIIIQVAGYDAQIISTEPLNAELSGYERVDDAIANVVQWNGHIFYIITFPTADRTWVYDLTTKMWHEWRSEIDNELPSEYSVRQGRFRGNPYVYFDGNHIFGDFESGKLYKLSESTYTDNSRMFICERTSRHFQYNLEHVSVNSIQIDVEAGAGLTSGQGSDPQFMLQVSKDGAQSWGPELWRTAGAVGKYRTRVKWNRLGTSRDFTFRLRVSDPTYRVIVGSVADIEVNV